MQCPRCKLINPDSAKRCDCGYDFETRSIEKPYCHQEDIPESSARRNLRGFLVFTTFLWITLGVIGLLPALFAIMLFDAPNSYKDLNLVIYFWSVFTFPVICIASILLSWGFYRYRSYYISYGVALMPATNILITVIFRR
jgi:hypothetical protein